MTHTNKTKTARLGFLSLTGWMSKAILLLMISTLFIAKESSATHFRYGHLTWKPVPGQPTTARFTLVDAFRRGNDPISGGAAGYPGSAPDGFAAVGDTINEYIGGTSLIFGDGHATGQLRYVVIAIDVDENWLVGQAIDPNDPTKSTIDHTYLTERDGSNPWIAEINTSSRTGGEANNPLGNYRLLTLVDLETGNSSPVSSLPVIIPMKRSAASTFPIPGADADANTRLNFRLATADEAGNGFFNQPAGLSIDSATGIVHWDNLFTTVGQLYSCQVIIEDKDATTGTLRTQVAVDFLIEIVECDPANREPYFTGATPANASVLTVQENQHITFTVTAADSDAVDEVDLNTGGLPAGATATPGLPTSGNPVSTQFDWTPGSGTSGPHIVTFTISDGCSSPFTSVTINVVACTSPQITCPPNKTVNIATGACHGTYGCSAIVTYAPATATGSPTPTITYSQASGTSFPGGTTTVTATATNSCGSTSCTFTVTVVDNVPPVANCKSITVALVNGTASITAAQVNNGSYDNCAITSMTVSPSTFNCSKIGCNKVTLTVKDAAGNQSTCCSNVTVTGSAPKCTVTATPCNNTYTGGNPGKIYIGYGPQSATMNASVTNGGANPSYLWSGSFLSCTTCAHPVFAPTAPGNYTITLTVTNASGCASTCTYTFCVMDIRVAGTSGAGQKVWVCHSYGCSPTNMQLLVSQVPSHIGCHSSDKLGKCSQACGTTARMAHDGEMVISDEATEMEMLVYPNPFSNDFHVRFENAGDEKISVRLYNLAGQTISIMTDIIPEKEITLGSDLKAGLYFLEIQQGDFRKVVKVNKAD